jgi:DNA invertase Pin-like site-specific DNA recombinase
MIRLAAYLRDSGGERQELSVEQQRQAIERWCADNDAVVTSWYADAARPGSSAVGREQFQEMIRYFRAGATEAGVIMWKLSRFARDIDDSQFYKADLRRRGYRIISLADNIPEGPEGRFFEAALDWMNQRFLEDLSEDVKRGLRTVVEQYGVIPGTPPRGFMRQAVDLGPRRDGSRHTGHRWVPDPALADQVRLAFEMRAGGASLAQIATATGLYKSVNCYTTFFRNRLYTGVLEYGDLVIDNYCEPIVAAETFAAVQARQASIPRHPRREMASTYSLSGLAHCARCGAPLFGKTSGGRPGGNYDRYACTGAKARRDCDLPGIPRLAVERSVIQTLREIAYDPDYLAGRQEERLQARHNQQDAIERQRSELLPRLAALRRKADNLAEAIAEQPSATLKRKLAEVEREEAQVAAEVERLARAELELPAPYSAAELAEMAANLRQALDQAEGDPSLAREILRGLVARVNLDRDEWKVFGQVVFFFPGVGAPTESVSVGALSHRRTTYTAELVPVKFKKRQP